MHLGILKEINDNRVSVIPEIVKKLIEENNQVTVESGAGINAFYSDEEYSNAGAKIANRNEVLKGPGILISISPIKDEELKKIGKDSIYISSFKPFIDESIIKKLAATGMTAMSLDMIPRITIAQSMDVLSSMASIAGYKAVAMASVHLPRYFPMLTTAAGSIPPSKVLILGAGVAGLQAIATARRLGAMVEAFDTRLAAREEVASLGAKFVEVEGARDDKDAGGYAVDQTEEYKQKQRELIAERVSKSDVVISTALLRGKPAPILVTKEMVRTMKPGSVIVDLAASGGGNCELTKRGEIIKDGTVTIIGLNDLSSTVPMHASQLYSKNIKNFLDVFLKDGELNLDMENEIVKSSCIVNKGESNYKSN